MNTNPKISIVVHSYNRERYIAETIESVLSQGYPNLELIVIDDNSSDRSWEIIQNYKDKISYMEKLNGKRDSPVEAINYGFSKSSGEIMHWINAKNILLHRSLFVVSDIFNSFPEVAWFTGLNSLLDDKSRVVLVGMRGKKSIYDFLVGRHNVIQQESTFWRRSLWNKVGGKFDPRYDWYFDFALWCKFFRYAEHFFIDTIIGAYRKIPSGKSTADRESLKPTENLIFNNFRKESSFTLRLSAYVYKILRLGAPILALIPHSIYVSLPFFKRYAINTISYEYQSGGQKASIKKENPFRPIL